MERDLPLMECRVPDSGEGVRMWMVVDALSVVMKLVRNLIENSKHV